MLDHVKIVELAKDRVPPKIIAKELGCNQNTVYRILRKARHEGERIALFSSGGSTSIKRPVVAPNPRQVVVPLRLFNLLEREAQRRGKTTTETAQRLLEDALLGRAVRHD